MITYNNEMSRKSADNEANISNVINTLDKTVSGVLKETDKIINPVRQTAFKRFPTMFLLLVTFGVSAVVFSFERLLMEWKYLYDRPWLILLLGITILVLTGKLYRKLS